MSHEFFNNMWAEAQLGLRKMLQEEKAVGPGGDTSSTMVRLAELFFNYVAIFKKLDECYDQIVHPQKRPLVRQVLDLVIARIIELREVMVSTEKSEFHYFDDYMQFYHWIPEDLDLPIPKYYTHGRSQEFEEREEWLKNMTGKNLGIQKENDESRIKEEEKAEAEREEKLREKILSMDPGEAVLIVQTMERARQGRERFKVVKYLYELEEKARAKKKRAKEKQMDNNRAAIIIQKLVRGFLARRRVKKLRSEELEFLGIQTCQVKKSSRLFDFYKESYKLKPKIELAAARRRKLQKRYQEEFEDSQKTLETRLRILEGPEMEEKMKYQIRKWFLQVKETTGKFPDIPKDEHGGSKFIFCPESLPDEVLEKALAARDGKKKKKRKNNNKDKSKSKKSKSKKGKKKKTIDEFKLGPPVHLEDMENANKEYNNKWRGKDESGNLEQKHEENLIIREKRKLVGDDVRLQVDKLMRIELEVLKKDLEKKKGKKKRRKGKKSKKKGGKKSKSKSKKGKRKSKKKRRGFGKDLTPDRSLQSLYEELVRNGIIKSYPKIRINDLLGDYSLINGTLRRIHANMLPPPNPDFDNKYPGNVNPSPSFGDIKRAVKDICILPMGSQTVHQLAPFTKSILFAGPTGSGKKSLVNAVCTELGATLFDLTAANIAGKYEEKSGLTMLIHLINKVGRLCQPSIIIIDSCEKLLTKKASKDDPTEPKRLKKPLTKFLKGIGDDDLIILIGLTNEPWGASPKAVRKFFPKIIYFPKPDYGFRLIMWRKMLCTQEDALNKDINFSLLAKLTDGWTIGAIKSCSQTVLFKYNAKNIKAVQDKNPATENYSKNEKLGIAIERQKISKIGKKNIMMNDILDELSQYDPIFIEQEKAWNVWFNKTSLQKARIKSQGGLKIKKKKSTRSKK